MAHPKHEQVRQRYNHRCGYCGVSEVDVGSELTVDHYQPLSADGDDSDDNLVYACMKCNQYKGDFFPTDDDLAYGRRVLHPLRDDVSDHVRENRQTRHLCISQRDGRHLDVEALAGVRQNRLTPRHPVNCSGMGSF